MPRRVMPLARLYKQHAEECARSAETTDNPAHRALFLKIADDWRRDAQRLRQEATESATRARQS
jgi:hypothetical protein